MNLKKTDPEIHDAVLKETERINNGLELIPSENFASRAVLEALGSVFNAKYSEGYPGKRYYGGNQFVDVVENLAIERAKKLFGVPHVNVQPYSGSPANLAVYFALCNPGDVIMGQNLPDGGHLTHGWKASLTGQVFRSIPYHVKKDGYLDLEEVEKLAKEHKPKLIWCGATAYVREFPFEEMGKIADEVGAYFVADIAHIAGLVAGGVHKSPVPYVHIITTTTHKTLRGPRGAMIMVTEKGLKKDPELAQKIDKSIFPKLQGGPHENAIAGIAVALKEAMQPEFREYAKQIVRNAKALAGSLMENGMDLVTGGTDNHMILVDLRNKNVTGKEAELALDKAGITVNKNMIPHDPRTPFDPSGIRLGTPAVTTRGMKEKEMKRVGEMIVEVINNIKDDSVKEKIRKEVLDLCKKFPVY
jgi:glycine hydroxymethyltransferase